MTAKHTVSTGPAGPPLLSFALILVVSFFHIRVFHSFFSFSVLHSFSPGRPSLLVSHILAAPFHSNPTIRYAPILLNSMGILPQVPLVSPGTE